MDALEMRSAGGRGGRAHRRARRGAVPARRRDRARAGARPPVRRALARGAPGDGEGAARARGRGARGARRVAPRRARTGRGRGGVAGGRGAAPRRRGPDGRRRSPRWSVARLREPIASGGAPSRRAAAEALAPSPSPREPPSRRRARARAEVGLAPDWRAVVDGDEALAASDDAWRDVLDFTARRRARPRAASGGISPAPTCLHSSRSSRWDGSSGRACSCSR